MKTYVILIFAVSIACFACKSKKSTASATSAEASSVTPPAESNNTASLTTTSAGEHTGKVSHKYRATGCSTVILLMQDSTELTLIPKDKLAGEFDVDGLEVRFNYRTLRMPQPEGCTVGQPAEITDLSKK